MNTKHLQPLVNLKSVEKKPKVITYFNKTKGVDTLNKMVRTAEYSCKKMTLRWPMVIFYTGIDTSVAKAFIVVKQLRLLKFRNKKMTVLNSVRKGIC